MINLYYCQNIQNLGDELSKYITEKPSLQNTTYNPHQPKFLTIGSLLNFDLIHAPNIIWGTGTISPTATDRLPKIFPIKRNIPLFFKRLGNHPHTATVLATRGPLTQKQILKWGISCPDIFGDPGILLPQIYFPNITKKHKIGVILHYTQEKLLKSQQIHNPDVHLISIQRQGNIAIENFVQELLSCEVIYSSSLHGLILAQSYGIPAQWIQIRNHKIHQNESHKFLDYFLGVNLEPQKPCILENINQVFTNDLYHVTPKLQIISEKISNKLLQTFPFLH